MKPFAVAFNVAFAVAFEMKPLPELGRPLSRDRPHTVVISSVVNRYYNTPADEKKKVTSDEKRPKGFSTTKLSGGGKPPVVGREYPPVVNSVEESPLSVVGREYPSVEGPPNKGYPVKEQRKGSININFIMPKNLPSLPTSPKSPGSVSGIELETPKNKVRT